jgi:hypothetical protein
MEDVVELTNSVMVFQNKSLPVKYASGFALLLGFVIGWLAGLVSEARDWLIAGTALFLGFYLMWDAVHTASRRVLVSASDLTVVDPLRFWEPRRAFAWNTIKTVELQIKDERRALRLSAEIAPKFFYEGLPYESALLEAIVDRTGLQPVPGQAAADLDALPGEGKHVYRWARKK